MVLIPDNDFLFFREGEYLQQLVWSLQSTFIPGDIWLQVWTYFEAGTQTTILFARSTSSLLQYDHKQELMYSSVIVLYETEVVWDMCHFRIKSFRNTQIYSITHRYNWVTFFVNWTRFENTITLFKSLIQIVAFAESRIFNDVITFIWTVKYSYYYLFNELINLLEGH